MKFWISTIFAFFSIISITTNAQTRNVVIGSLEQDSIEKANFYNKNFHSEIKTYTEETNNQNIYGLQKNGFQVLPIENLSLGYQSNGENKTLYNTFLGISPSYSFKQKLTVSASVLCGLTSNLQHRQQLDDSLDFFPQLGYFKKNDNNYFVKYFEFYINYRPVDFLLLSLGKGKKQVGEGLRPAIISSSNSGMYYFDLRVDMKNVCYVFSVNGAKNLDTKLKTNKTKWTVYHLVSWNIAKWLSIGGYEAVCLVRRDSVNNSKFVDLHYLNPLIFSRPIEYSLGSPDNEILGVFGKLKFYQQTLYAQAMIDEFKIKEVKSSNGWWANKYSLQCGAKGFVKDFSYNLEFNYIRPYMYSHDDANNSYSMFSQPIANPYGANLKEALCQIKYYKNRISACLTIDYIEQGKDFGDKYSYGGNILRSYNSRKQEYNNSVGQGLNTKFTNISLLVSYNPEFLKNFSVYLQGGKFDNNKFVSIGIKTALIPFDTTF
ncbi:MAG: hypothetical protein IJ150_07950 [Bacteroidales bacterium]|nr:hypothetical protein [Bacteroidales bacterium]